MADNYTMSGGDIYGGSLPFSMEAEQSVLGAAVIDPGKIPDIMEDMKPEYFYRKQHSELYAMLVRMFSVGATIDVITILDNVRKEGIFDTPEDAKIYLAQLAQVVPTTANVASYAKIVREKYYLRSLILASREIVDNASDAQADADELLNLAEQKIYDIRQGRDTGNIVPISKVLVETYDHLQKISGENRKDFLGISSGYSALDSFTTGLNKSDLILIAARPGMGKT
ncbi:MAG: DnaB-like helicase N-terminal domain-containing protein, partial [Angelakisella sp.]